MIDLPGAGADMARCCANHQSNQVLPSVIPTTGLPVSSNVTLSGRSFGSARDMAREVAVGDSECDVEKGWVSDTSMVCAAPGAGIGRVVVSVTVASQACGAGCSALDFKYTSPAVDQIKADSLPLSPAGGGALTVMGSGFGFQSGQATVSLGTTECRQTTYLSDSTLVCTPPAGAGAHLQLAVEVGGQRWVGDAGVNLRYERPVLSAAFPRMLPGGGGDVVTVWGTSLNLDARDYEAVWVSMADGSSRESVTAVTAIRALGMAPSAGGGRVEMTIATPDSVGAAMGPSLLFLRDGGDQTSNRLVAGCDISAIKGAQACLHLGNRSPVLAIRVHTPYDGAHGITQQEDAFNTSAWRIRFASFLAMPSDEQIFVISVYSDTWQQAGGTRRIARSVHVAAAIGLDDDAIASDGLARRQPRYSRLRERGRGRGRGRSQRRQDWESRRQAQQEGDAGAAAHVVIKVYFLSRHRDPCSCLAFVKSLQARS